MDTIAIVPTPVQGFIHFVCFFCGKLSPAGNTQNETTGLALYSKWARVRSPFYDHKRWACKKCRVRHSEEIREATELAREERD